MEQPTCHRCGASLVKPPRGRTPKWCSEQCRNRSRYNVPDVRHHRCAACGETWTRTPTKGQVPTYCPDCRNGSRVIECKFCGQSRTISYAGSGAYCSTKCAQRAMAGWSTSTDLVHLGPVARPRWAARPDPKRSDWWQLIVQGSCAHCGDTFTGLAASPATAPMFCSDRCARKASKARRRARKVGGFVANVSRRRIFERDRWTCQLCRKPVARTKAVPHPRAPVLDHIIPLAKGGTHEPRNVQCAHFLCNSIKSDGGTDQLRLIG